MRIHSPAFEHNGAIPEQYTCDGDNVSPPLVFADVPKEAQSLALIVDDPDAPRGLWVHWTLWNIPPNIKEIPENSVPAGATEGVTSFGGSGWGGPCPPSGTHRYFFRLYALDMSFELDSTTDKTDLEAAMTSHVIASAELIGLYSKNKDRK